jgi:hypothetical protein
VQRTGDGRTGQVLGGRPIDRLGGTVCGLDHARGDEECEFLGWASKPRSTVYQWFGLKITGTFFSNLTSKLVAMVSSVWPQNRWQWFLGSASKPRWWRVFRFGPQNCDYGLVIWASKSPRRFLGLCLKTKQALICRLRHKTDGGRSAWYTHRDLAACFMWKQVWLGFPSLASRLAEARWRVVHVAPSCRLRRS